MGVFSVYRAFAEQQLKVTKKLEKYQKLYQNNSDQLI